LSGAKQHFEKRGEPRFGSTFFKGGKVEKVEKVCLAPPFLKVEYIIMGCDFYIYVYLEIEHNKGISYFQFPTIRGYYCELGIDHCNSDDENDENNNSIEYQKLYEDMKRLCLTARNPFIIYENNSFITPKVEIKYLPIIQDKINKTHSKHDSIHKDTGILKSIEDIIKITKKEIRYDPYEYIENEDIDE